MTWTPETHLSLITPCCPLEGSAGAAFIVFGIVSSPNPRQLVCIIFHTNLAKMRTTTKTIYCPARCQSHNASPQPNPASVVHAGPELSDAQSPPGPTAPKPSVRKATSRAPGPGTAGRASAEDPGSWPRAQGRHPTPTLPSARTPGPIDRSPPTTARIRPRAPHGTSAPDRPYPGSPSRKRPPSRICPLYWFRGIPGCQPPVPNVCLLSGRQRRGSSGIPCLQGVGEMLLWLLFSPRCF